MKDHAKVSCVRDLNLHDSVLLDVVIKLDQVTVHLDYIDDYETMRISRRSLVFRRCSRVSVAINTGYATPNSILAGDECTTPEGRKIRIEMNTTASVIEITAEEVELL
ncbi:MAG: hypothetical protein NTU45_09950 [Planctomycetota bacterium]|jgi:hypothetical protein|nr:hypothetical protein [Planctomycetota bacterium]